jgi:hypothetical protein
MISEKRLGEALTYLAETDERAAILQTEMERAEFKAKAVKDAIFIHLKGETVAERTALAGSSPEYREAMALYFESAQEYQAMRNKRSTESIVVDVWRSLNSSRNKGNL